MALLAALLLTAAGVAGPAEAALPSGGAGYAAIAVPIPSIALEGGSDGNAALRLSGGLLFSLSPRWDLAPRLSLQASADDGLGTLLSWTSAAEAETPPPWAIGAGVVLTHFPERTRDEGLDAVKGTAYRACAAVCARTPAPAGCEPFLARRRVQLGEDRARWRAAVARDLAPDELCAARRAEAAAVQARQAAGAITPAEAAQAREALLAECVAGCDSPWTADPYCERARAAGLPMETPPRRFEDAELCPDGAALLAAHRRRPPHRQAITRHPAFTLRLGGRLGRAQLESLWSDPTGGAGALAPRTVVRTPASAGGGFARLVADRSATLEGLLVYDRFFGTSGPVARWCTPAGTVSGAPAQTCRELPLGAPVKVETLRAAVYGGYLDPHAGAWRAAAGLDVTLVGRGGTEVSLAAPVWVSLARTDGYRGVARVTPSFTWITDGGRTTRRALLSVALLGQPGLFSQEFDRL